jgi:hypothetical protein
MIVLRREIGEYHYAIPRETPVYEVWTDGYKMTPVVAPSTLLIISNLGEGGIPFWKGRMLIYEDDDVMSILEDIAI